MAFIIGSNIGYLLLTFIPPIAWLMFYLREDENPEPKRLIITTFLGGILIALPAAVFQYYLIKFIGIPIETLTSHYPLAIFALVALIEEYAKYFVVRYLISMRPEFDEPIDAMIYMMSAAMGFAAIENALFAFPVFRVEFFSGLQVVAGRFLGANLLHVLASGVLGYFLAKSFISPWRKSFFTAGIVLATILHTLFNYLIIIRETVSQGFAYLIMFLFVAALIVFTEFERLKRRKINLTPIL